MEPQPPPRPWFERRRFVGPIAAVAIFVGLVFAANDSDGSVRGTLEGATSLGVAGSHPAVDDIRLLGCRRDPADHWTPHVAVTNHSSKPSAYVLAFDLEDRDHHRKLGEAAVVVDRVEPGRTVEQVGVSSVRGDDVFCRATSVIRVAA